MLFYYVRGSVLMSEKGSANSPNKLNDTSFLASISREKISNPEGNVFSNIWDEYEKVVLHSLITSFGLDFLVHDQTGGDVDTIHNVRQNGIYKSEDHRLAYEDREPYNQGPYHSHKKYTSNKDEKRQQFNKTGIGIEDEYVPRNTVYPNNASGIDSTRRANLDHVIAAKEIHDDPGRILAGLDGTELANSEKNLCFTNEHINKGKGKQSVDEYLENNGKNLPNETKQAMQDKDKEARAAYGHKLNMAYYQSVDFVSEAVNAATSRGLEMGVRQAVGFIFVELWFSCKTEILNVPDQSTFEDYINAIKAGVQVGFSNIKNKYKDLLLSFCQGFNAGFLASLTTTLCNIFFETSERTIRNIRNIYAAITQAGAVLLFNPNDLRLGDRIQTASVILATGANTVIGSSVGDAIAKTPIGQFPVVGRPIQIFSSTMISGLLSCTFLLFLDRSKFINQLLHKLNQYLTEEQAFQELAEQMEKEAAILADIDFKQFHNEVNQYSCFANRIQHASSEEELKIILLETCKDDDSLPWQGDLDEFMSNPNNSLIFE